MHVCVSLHMHCECEIIGEGWGRGGGGGICRHLSRKVRQSTDDSFILICLSAASFFYILSLFV